MANVKLYSGNMMVNFQFSKDCCLAVSSLIVFSKDFFKAGCFLLDAQAFIHILLVISI
jgi:hypothetical protein